MELSKVESISKIFAAICIPVVVTIFGAQVNTITKQKETETKLVEVASIILSKEIPPRQSSDQKELRTWAVNVINRYSGVPMSSDTQAALVSTISLPTATTTAPVDEAGTFGVVFGGDRTIDAARDEVKRANSVLDNAEAQIFLRMGSYRTVVVFVSRSEAEEALGKLKALRGSSYVIDMSKWCPSTTKQETHFECKV
jgi:hypothetical protein